MSMLYTKDFVQVWSLARFFSCFHDIEMSHILISSKETKRTNCFQILLRTTNMRENRASGHTQDVVSECDILLSTHNAMGKETVPPWIDMKSSGLCQSCWYTHSLHTECLKKTGPIKSMWHLTLYYCLLLHRAVWRESHCVKKTKDDCLQGMMAIICHPFWGPQSLENIYGSRMWLSFIQTFTELFS